MAFLPQASEVSLRWWKTMRHGCVILLKKKTVARSQTQRECKLLQSSTLFFVSLDLSVLNLKIYGH